MISFLEFCQLHEDFNNVMDFLLNPEHRNKTWQQLMGEFEESGGQLIGVGKHGNVFSHPKWNYVVKMFDDPYYLRFVRFTGRYPHKSFPKFYGVAQKIIPFYRRTKAMATTYIVRIEKLNEVKDKEMLQEMRNEYMGGLSYFNAVERGQGDAEFEKEVYPSFKDRKKGVGITKVKEKVYKKVLDLFAKYPQARSVYEGLHLISKYLKEGAFDIHAGNFMERNNGDLVIIDPLWEGSNPYADAQRAMDMEIDRYGYEEPDKENLMGGELPKNKRKRKKKPKPEPYIPF